MTYSNTIAMGRQYQSARTLPRGQNSVTFNVASKRLGPVSNTIILVVLACLLGLLYLTQVTKTNTYGYTLHSLEKEQTSLKSQHDDLSIASARLQALDRVQSSAEAKALVAIAPSGVTR